MEVPHKKWEALSGFIDGVSDTVAFDHDDMHKELYEYAKDEARLWFGVPLTVHELSVEFEFSGRISTVIQKYDFVNTLGVGRGRKKTKHR